MAVVPSGCLHARFYDFPLSTAVWSSKNFYISILSVYGFLSKYISRQRGLTSSELRGNYIHGWHKKLKIMHVRLYDLRKNIVNLILFYVFFQFFLQFVRFGHVEAKY